jgi:transposase-like protein
MKIQSQRKHSIEFKIKAVEQSLESPDTVKMTALKLGLHPALLSRWRNQMTSKKHTNKPIKNLGPDKSYTDLERQVRKLEKQLEEAQLENDVLKKATAYFDSL